MQDKKKCLKNKSNKLKKKVENEFYEDIYFFNFIVNLNFYWDVIDGGSLLSFLTFFIIRLLL